MNSWHRGNKKTKKKNIIGDLYVLQWLGKEKKSVRKEETSVVYCRDTLNYFTVCTINQCSCDWVPFPVYSIIYNEINHKKKKKSVLFLSLDAKSKLVKEKISIYFESRDSYPKSWYCPESVLLSKQGEVLHLFVAVFFFMLYYLIV